MSTLIKLGPEGWQTESVNAALEWKTTDAWQPGEALLLSVDDEPDPRYAQASAIGIEFSAFTDGRGLSLAVLIRTRLLFSGELRAVGAIHEDVLHYMIRCGFDALELPVVRDPSTALGVLEPYSGLYQASVGVPGRARHVQRVA